MAGEGTEALEQLGLLNNQFARTMAPLDNYSQNLLALAVQKRQREQQLQDTAAQQTFQASQSAKQQAFQLRLEQAANTAAVNRQQAAWDHAEKEKQADLLREAEAEASRMNVDVSSIKGDERSRYLAIQGKLNAAHSATITSLLQQGAKLRQELSTLTNVDPTRLDQIAKQQFLSDPEISAAFGPDIPAIQRDSSEIARIIDRLSSSKKKEDKEKLSMLVSKWNGAQAAAEIEVAKYSPHREQVELIRDQLQTQRAILASQLKGTDLTAETIGTMLGGVADEVGKMKREVQGPPAPDPAKLFRDQMFKGGAAIPAIPPQQFRQPSILSKVGPAIGSVAGAVTAPIAAGARLFSAGAQQAASDLFGGPSYPTQWYTNPNAAGDPNAPLFAPPAPTQPSSQANYSLLNWLMKQQQMRGAQTPLAAPPSPTSTNSPIAIDF